MEQYFYEYKGKLKKEFSRQKEKIAAVEEALERKLTDFDLVNALGEVRVKNRITPEIAVMPEKVENTKLKELKCLEDELKTAYESLMKDIQEAEKENLGKRKEQQENRINEYKKKVSEIESKLTAVQYPR